MSGIAGIFHTDERPVNREALDRMMARLAHRGPDGSGVWVDGCAGLGHRMFWETPESLHEHQPCIDQEARLVVTADARIDNRDDLIRQLSLGGRDPLTIPDSQLILKSYAKWDEDCVDHLMGDFAFALWDGRKKSLFCARDYIGVKSLYYEYWNNRFLFASELKGILCLAGPPRLLNKEMVANYLALDFEDNESTIYRDVLRLPPAHALRVDARGISRRCYWKPDTIMELRLKSDAEYAEAFRERFSQAVACRLRSAFPVGCLLSGGLDSSSVTCMARDLLKQEGDSRVLKTFTATFEHLPQYPQINERRYQNTIIAAGGIEPHLVPMKKMGPLEAYLNGQQHMDYPYLGFTCYMQRGIMPQVQTQGVRILLDGMGGDDIVSHGFGYLNDLLKQLRLISFAREAIALAKNWNLSASRVMWNLGLREATPPILRTLLRSIRHRRLAKEPPLLGEYPIASGLLQSTDLLARTRKKGLAANLPSNMREGHACAMTHGLTPFTFEVNDQLGYEFHIVSRSPFYDRRLAEFCLALPHTQKVSAGWTRIVLRRAMEGILPVENQWRRGKASILPHLLHKMRSEEKQLILQMMGRIRPVLQDFVDIAKLEGVCHEFLSESGQDELYRSLWPAISLGAFLLDCPMDAQDHGKEVA